MKYFSFFIVICIVFTFPCLSDEEMENEPFREYSLNKKYYIDFKPYEVFGNKGVGLAYSTKNDSLLWKVNWYAPRVYLSDCGKYLIRMGNWGRDQEYFTDLAISFYENGVELKRYRVKDLILDKESIVKSVSHYQWSIDKTDLKEGFSLDQSTFTIVTIDKWALEFSTSSGIILNRYKDTSAKTGEDIENEIKARQIRRAQKIYNQSFKIKQLEQYFQIIEMSYYDKIYISEFNATSKKWVAKLVPRYYLPEFYQIDLIYYVFNDTIQPGTTPLILFNMLDEIHKSGFIQNMINKKSIEKIRFRVVGKKLHSDPLKVKKYQNILANNHYPLYELNDWIELIIDLDKNRMFSLLHPKGSRFFIITFLNFEYPNLEQLTSPLTLFDQLSNRYIKSLMYDFCTILDFDGNIVNKIRIK